MSGADRAAKTAITPGKVRDPSLRGWALAWRLGFVLASLAAMMINRLDIGTSLLFCVCVAFALYRLPRMVRLIRARDWISASPWLLLAAGTAVAIAHQNWALHNVESQFKELVLAVQRDPCRGKAMMPAVVRTVTSDGITRHTLKAGLVEYPLFVREDLKQATLTLVLHIDIDDVRSQAVSTKGCVRTR